MKRFLAGERAFVAALAAGLLIKAALAAMLPLIGDELLYVGVWGRHLAWGYYEHPPMTGWISSLLLLVSEGPAWVRLPAIALGPGIAWGISRLLGGAAGRAMGLAFYCLPVSLFVVVLATDTALIGWSFLAVYAFWRSEESGWPAAWAAGAGLAWGAAFLSKYFAVLLLPSLAAYLFWVAAPPTRLRRAWAFWVAASPALLLHLAWNATHCWSNVVYNLFNRNGEEVGGWFQVHKFLGHQLYLLTPVIPLLSLWRWRAVLALARRRGGSPESRQFWLFGLCFAIPFLFFAVLSARAAPGLHYSLAFLPFLFVALGRVLERPQRRVLVGAMAAWAAAHGGLLAWALHQPLSHWKGKPFYRGLVMHSRAGELARQFAPYAESHVLASDSYTNAAALAYATHRDVAVFGGGLAMAREDDRLTDYSRLAGRSFAFFWPAGVVHEHLRFFKKAELKPFEMEGLTFYLVLAEGFDYRRYHDEVLTWVRRMFYAPVAGLPQWGCPFTERYFAK